MGLFRKKREFVDLGQRSGSVRKSTGVPNSFSSGFGSANENSQSSSVSEGGGMFGIFGNANVASTATSSGVSGSSSSSEYADLTSSGFNSNPEADERRKKLTKRILDMTEKIEDLSNQIYRLQQRIEVLEKKSNVGGRY